MPDKQTRCPKCDTTYKVSVTQLTVAQGMVCCPKCSNTFNALSHLIQKTTTPPIIQSLHTDHHPHHNINVSKSSVPTIESPITSIFKWKPKNSNIDLITYLNNLTQFNNNPISNTPSLNLSSNTQEPSNKNYRKKSVFYYLIWSVSNVILLSIFLFQILWFNPNINEKYPPLNLIFTKVCSILSCDTADQRYYQINIEGLNVQQTNENKKHAILFSGVLMNHYKKSLALPHIRVKFRKNRIETATYIVLPEQYLKQSLSTIKRIPTESPFPFNFSIPIAPQAYDHYHLEVIHP